MAPQANGKEVTHSFDHEAFFTVRLTATSATCPTPQPLKATQIIQVGNPLQYKALFPARSASKHRSNVLEAKPGMGAYNGSESACRRRWFSAGPFRPRVTQLALAIPIASLNQPDRSVDYNDQGVCGPTCAQYGWYTPRVLVHWPISWAQPGRNIELFYGKIDRVHSCITITQITSSEVAF